MKNITLLFLAVSLALTACSQKEQPTALPASWHQLPEDQSSQAATEESESDITAKDEVRIAPVADDIADATAGALEDTQKPPSFLSTSLGPVKSDRVPWHMEYLMTDLSVSVSGVLGSLVMKGSPAITFIWRKQSPHATHSFLSAPMVSAPSATDVPAELSITSETSEHEMTMQLEPAIRMALSTGRVKDEKKLRGNLQVAARDFQSLASGIGQNPGREWWVSRLRLDLTVEATGAVTPTIGVGGDLRFRFEWHRIMKAGSPPPATAPKLAMLGSIKGSSLNEFISSMSEDLSVLSETGKQPEGFKAYSFRVGLGMSAKGDIGITKSSASLIGQVYFSRDVAKPKVNPKFALAAFNYVGTGSEPGTINLIESTTAPKSELHQRFARANGFGMMVETTGNQVVYKVDRSRMRKGLQRAAQMGQFFGKHSATSSKGKWKVFEMRTAVDLSLTGKVGLTEVAGLATAEINFYNQSF
jgi:hypothetical protein